MIKKSVSFCWVRAFPLNVNGAWIHKLLKKGFGMKIFENGIVLVSKQEALFLVKTVHGHCHTFSAWTKSILEKANENHFSF